MIVPITKEWLLLTHENSSEKKKKRFITILYDWTYELLMCAKIYL